MGLKALIINPVSETETYWSFLYAMYAVPKNRFGGLKAPFPPLWAMMIAEYLKTRPEYEEVEVKDRNVDKGSIEPSIKRADHIYLGAWDAQLQDLLHNAALGKTAGKKVFAGGRLIRHMDNTLIRKAGIDHAVKGEAETGLPQLLDDLFHGRAKDVYYSEHTPPDKYFLPDYTVIDPRNYFCMNVQFSRGCPFSCDFCDIGLLDGKETRVANDEYIAEVMKRIHRTGFKGNLFIVDDNNIGIPKESIRVSKAICKIEDELHWKLPKLTQLSLNISDDTPLMAETRYWSRQAGIVKGFVGIETNNEDAHNEARKKQNIKGEKTIEEKIMFAINGSGKEFTYDGATRVDKGIRSEIMTGAMTGFDSDTRNKMQPFKDFFNGLPTPTIMLSLLNALRGTPLFNRMMKEGRLFSESQGNNSDGKINFVPKNMSQMEFEVDIYPSLLNAFYNEEAFFKRRDRMLETLNPVKLSSVRSLWESAYSAYKILFTGENKGVYWRHLLGALNSIGKNILSQVVPEDYGNMSRLEKLKKSPEIIFKFIKKAVDNWGFLPFYLIGESFVQCAQYTHFKTTARNVIDDITKRHYQPIQKKSYSDILAAKSKTALTSLPYRAQNSNF